MNMQLVNEVTKSQLKKDVPFFKSGSTVRVHVKIKEGDKSRIQVFEGLVIA
ncbi:MAG: 50S ribosomal protein L19, partial [Clostridium sp.]